MGSNKKQDQAVIILTFDDGRKDQKAAFRILESAGLPAVLNVCPGYIDGRTGRIGPDESMSWDEIRAVGQNPLFEISSHSYSHTNEWEDILKGRESLVMHLGRLSGWQTGFASPGSKLRIGNRKSYMKECRREGILYVRVGAVFRSFGFLKKVGRKISLIFTAPSLYKWVYADSLADLEEDFCFSSIPVLRQTTVRQLQAVIDLAVRKHKVCILMFHSIAEPDRIRKKDPWSWETERFIALTEILRNLRLEEKIAVCTLRDHVNSRQSEEAGYV